MDRHVNAGTINGQMHIPTINQTFSQMLPCLELPTIAEIQTMIQRDHGVTQQCLAPLKNTAIFHCVVPMRLSTNAAAMTIVSRQANETCGDASSNTSQDISSDISTKTLDFQV